MSVALAEQPPASRFYLIEDQPIVVVPELPTEQLVQKRAERLFRTAGSVAISGLQESEIASDIHYKNLQDALTGAAKGEQAARRMITANVATDIFERTIKAGFVLSTTLETDENGRIIQHGQTNEQIQANTLFHCASNTKMLPRYQAETRNSYRLDAAKREGLLEDYWFLVISPCADDMTDEELAGNGFFVPTKSMAVQVTTADGDEVIMQSAFVTGVTSEDTERHDKNTIRTFGENLGTDLTGTAAEIIDRPLLIPKTLMPNGVIDLVRMIDDAAGGTFFGQDVPRQDYIRFLAGCKKREKEMQPKVEMIVTELVSKAGEVKAPVEAIKLLDKVVGKHMVEAAVEDERIDPRVFGTKAAWHIADARAHIATGDMMRAQQALRFAVRTERSSSCPGGAKKASETLDGISDEYGDSLNPASQKEEDISDCDFVSKECPMCHAKNVKTTVKGGVYYGECGCDSKHGKRKATQEKPRRARKTAATVISLASRRRQKEAVSTAPEQRKEAA